MNSEVIARSACGETSGVDRKTPDVEEHAATKQSRPSRCTTLAALAGFLLSLQTIWILRPGMLGGVPWPLATIGVYASDVVFTIAAVVGVVRLWRGKAERKENFLPLPPGGGVKRGRANHHSVSISIALLTALAVVNAWMSADPWLSAVGWVRIILFLLAVVGLPTWSAAVRRAFLGGFLLAMLGHVVLGFIQFFTLEAWPSTLFGIATHNAWTLGDSVITAPGERWLRAYGGFPHPNVFGTAVLVALTCIPFVISTRPGRGEISHESTAGPTREISRLRSRVVASLEMTMWVVLTFSLVLSFSRSAWLGFLILLLVMALRRSAPEKYDRTKLEQRPLAVVGAVAFVAFLLVLWPLVAPRFTGSTPNEQRSLSERSRGLEAAIAFGSAPPYLGIGLHALPKVLWEFRPYLREHTVTPWTWAQPTHNVPLLALAEIGALGVLVLVLVLVLYLRWPYGLRSRRVGRDPDPKASGLTAYGSTVWLPLAPSLLFDHHLWSLPVGLALVFVLAVATIRSQDVRST